MALFTGSIACHGFDPLLFINKMHVVVTMKFARDGQMGSGSNKIQFQVHKLVIFSWQFNIVRSGGEFRWKAVMNWWHAWWWAAWIIFFIIILSIHLWPKMYKMIITISWPWPPIHHTPYTPSPTCCVYAYDATLIDNQNDDEKNWNRWFDDKVFMWHMYMFVYAFVLFAPVLRGVERTDLSFILILFLCTSYFSILLLYSYAYFVYYFFFQCLRPQSFYSP